MYLKDNQKQQGMNKKFKRKNLQRNINMIHFIGIKDKQALNYVNKFKFVCKFVLYLYNAVCVRFSFQLKLSSISVCL